MGPVATTALGAASSSLIEPTRRHLTLRLVWPYNLYGHTNDQVDVHPRRGDRPRARGDGSALGRVEVGGAVPCDSSRCGLGPAASSRRAGGGRSATTGPG